MSVSSRQANTRTGVRVPSRAAAASDRRPGADTDRVPGRTAVGRLYLVSLAVWCALLVIAVVNGAVREFVLVRFLGPTALPVSGLTAMTAFAVAIAAFVRATRPPVAAAARIGALWLLLSLVLETALTMAAGRPASDVAMALSPTALSQGNLLLPLLLLTALAPAACARLMAPPA